MNTEPDWKSLAENLGAELIEALLSIEELKRVNDLLASRIDEYINEPRNI